MRGLNSKKKLAAASVALAVIGGSGVAIAASDSGASPSSFLDSVANHLGISREELDDATRAAAIDQVDAALEAGRITEEEAERLKEQIESGEVPPFFGLPLFPHFSGPRGDGERGFDFRFEFRHDGGPAAGASISAAAEYLGLTVDQVEDRLADGETLAEIAKAERRTAEGLVDAFLAEAKERLDEAVEEGRLTNPERADEILERLEAVIRDFVENGLRGIGELRGHHGPPGLFLPPEPDEDSSGARL